MPILKKERHELFAQKLAAGKTATEAYVLAGFKRSRTNAARLRSDERIGQRVFELQQASAAGAGAKITLEGLLDELEHARQRADSLGQLSASVRAISEKARLAGLVVERSQVEVVNVNPYEDTDAARVLRWRSANRDRWLATHRAYMKVWRARKAQTLAGRAIAGSSE